MMPSMRTMTKHPHTGPRSQPPRIIFVADFRNEDGKRIRRNFLSADEAIEFESQGRRRSQIRRLSREIGTIAGTASGISREFEIRRLLKESSQVAHMAALGHRLPTSTMQARSA